MSVDEQFSQSDVDREGGDQLAQDSQIAIVATNHAVHRREKSADLL